MSNIRKTNTNQTNNYRKPIYENTNSVRTSPSFVAMDKLSELPDFVKRKPKTSINSFALKRASKGSGIYSISFASRQYFFYQKTVLYIFIHYILSKYKNISNTKILLKTVTCCENCLVTTSQLSICNIM